MKNQTAAKKHAPYIAFKRALAGLGLTYKDVAELLKCHEATVQMKIKVERKQEEAERQAALKTEERLGAIEDTTEVLKEAMKFVLYDRIRFLGQAYIADKEIDFDDRRILNNMHHTYHFGLCGNGDLDTLMEEVNHLPLKTR